MEKMLTLIHIGGAEKERENTGDWKVILKLNFPGIANVDLALLSKLLFVVLFLLIEQQVNIAIS